MAISNQVRIIGGRWRGRKLEFPSIDGLRPTPDRVRETLFNWLQTEIHGAACLDLFAGSGILGIEAMSRGAAHVTLVEKDSQAIISIQAMVNKLEADDIAVHREDVLHFLQRPLAGQKSWNIVFLDPPYASNLVVPCLQQLCVPGWLAPNALIYFETQKRHAPITLPPELCLLKEKKAGQVAYFLARYNGRP